MGYKRDAAVVGATIAMAKLLNATVTAEGVETKQQLAFLRKRQCDTAQGYYLSKPVDASSLEKLIREDVRETQSFGRATESTPDFEPGAILSEAPT